MKKKRFIFFFLVCCLSIFLLSAWQFRFFPFEKLYLRIPFQFIESNVPLTEIKVNGTTYLVDIDLGHSWELSLRPEILDKIEKRYLRTDKWFDIKGNIYESAIYLVPEIHMGKAILNNVTIAEDSVEFHESGSLIDGPEEPDTVPIKGSIGRLLFRSVNVIFDFKSSHLYIIKKSTPPRSLQKAGYDLQQFSELPIEVKPWGILTTVETDYGPLKLVLDTGATAIFVQPSAIKDLTVPNKRITTSKFALGNKDFGEQKLFLFQFTERLQHIDGLLGMDFFEDKILYLDLQNKKALISP